MKSIQTISSKLQLHSGPAKFLSWIKFSKGKLSIPRRGQKDFWRDLSRLKKLGLVETETRDGFVKVKLTEEGESEYLKIKIYQTGPLARGLICVVVFDIPEKKREERKLLRFFLKEFGFEKIQKSVWISPFDVAEPLIEFVKARKLDGWIRVFTAKESF